MVSAKRSYWELLRSSRQDCVSSAEAEIFACPTIAPVWCAAGCLILASTSIGNSCTLGRRSVMPAGSNLEANKMLMPYASPTRVKGIVDQKEGRKLYPHFYAGKSVGTCICDAGTLVSANSLNQNSLPRITPYAERHMHAWAKVVSALLSSLLNTVSFIPGACLALYVLVWTYNLVSSNTPVMGAANYNPPLQAQSCFNSLLHLLSTAQPGSAVFWKVVLLPVAATLAFGCVFVPTTMVAQLVFNLLWKRLVRGCCFNGFYISAYQPWTTCLPEKLPAPATCLSTCLLAGWLASC